MLATIDDKNDNYIEFFNLQPDYEGIYPMITSLTDESGHVTNYTFTLTVSALDSEDKR
jgi:hypothetical protein